MNVIFHTVASLGIAHLFARGVSAAAPRPFVRADALPLAGALVSGVLSHGILDGLKHGYPVYYWADPPLAALLALVWAACVKRRFRPLFAAAFLGAIFPDLLDHGPDIVRQLLAWPMPSFDNVFPWHWNDGTGSLHELRGRTPRPDRQYLEVGRNAAVSLANHVIVLFFSGVAILSNLRPLRVLAPRPTS
jgi:hypothetical protein